MDKHPKVLVETKDLGLVQRVIRGLCALGIDTFWVTEEEGQKLAGVWDWDQEP